MPTPYQQQQQHQQYTSKKQQQQQQQQANFNPQKVAYRPPQHSPRTASSTSLQYQQPQQHHHHPQPSQQPPQQQPVYQYQSGPNPDYFRQQSRQQSQQSIPQQQQYSQQQPMYQSQQPVYQSIPAPPPPQQQQHVQPSYLQSPQSAQVMYNSHSQSPQAAASLQLQYQKFPTQQSRSGSGTSSQQFEQFQSSSTHAVNKKPPSSMTGSPPRTKPSNRSKESIQTESKSSLSKQKLEIELRSVFEKVDVNKSGRISGKELSYALLNFDHTRFRDSTIKLMLNLFTNKHDPTASASSSTSSYNSNKSLNFEQFVSLWKYLSAYKKLFVQADANKSGDISFGEFQKILEQIGYKLDIDLVLHLFSKYSIHEEGEVGRLKFDSFVELLVYLRKLTDIFKKYDKNLSGTATIEFSDFLFEISNMS
ncbi:hypothetical protein KGF56_001916 [Candida oxycetoniae]|uniref:EF-hand domain-containing protein n=1 Tax=Candida oxycetoniae TaxID=497107 RepID=A0AAI9SY63_9ASCO|nr:uncharacterized protein KGF56_001916 [Candida oxycetoniae]KAI3405285.2 hypothetical protein KGF56_001916 [Candida oxycetoniae]